MNRRSMLAVSACFLIDPKLLKSDEEKLRGTWRCVSAEQDEKPARPEFASSIKLSFEKDGFVWSQDDGEGERGTFKVDPSNTPMTIDLIFSPGAINRFGIYQIEGNTLKLCVGAERPSEFASKLNHARCLWVFKRE